MGFAILLAAFVAFGITCWFFTTMIDKSNNKGDSKGDFASFTSYPLLILDKEDNKRERIPLR